MQTIQVKLDGTHEPKICCTKHALKMQNDLDKGLVDTVLQYCYWEKQNVKNRNISETLKGICIGHIDHIEQRTKGLI